VEDKRVSFSILVIDLSTHGGVARIFMKTLKLGTISPFISVDRPIGKTCEFIHNGEMS